MYNYIITEPDVEDSTFSRQTAHRWKLGLSAFSAGCLYFQEGCSYLFLLEAVSTRGANIRRIGESGDLTGNRSSISCLVAQGPNINGVANNGRAKAPGVACLHKVCAISGLFSICLTVTGSLVSHKPQLWKKSVRLFSSCLFNDAVNIYLTLSSAIECEHTLRVIKQTRKQSSTR
jgi:hypothetical protein